MEESPTTENMTNNDHHRLDKNQQQSQSPKPQQSPPQKQVTEVVRPRKLPIPLYVPNLIGYTRIILAFMGLSTSLHSPSKTVILWSSAALLDMVDGVLARKLHQTSTLGIYIDIVADNVLRTTCWIGVLMSMIKVTTTTRTNAPQTHGFSIIIPTALLCLEWITMICTQLQSSHDEKHWKDKQSASSSDDDDRKNHNTQLSSPYPWWIQELFRNNFINPLGIWSIWGSFAAPIFWYVHYYPTIFKTWVPHEILLTSWTYLTFGGRFLAACCEVWLCWHYVKTILLVQEQEQQQQQQQQQQQGNRNGHQKRL